MSARLEVNRRSFLKASLAASGALMLCVHVPIPSRAEGISRLGEPGADFQPNAFIKVGRDGKVTVVVGQSEMGQGVLTSLPMIVADELEVDWSDVSYESALADKAFANPMLGGNQVTGASSSIRAFFEPLRKSAAAVREMIVAAGAQQWNVAPETCKAEAGKVVHLPTKRTIAYGDLLEAAAKITPPADPKLKDPKDFKIVGKSMLRLDTPCKTNGSGVYGIDIKLPGLLTASILRCPFLEGKVAKIEDTAARSVKGVRFIVPLEYGVGVVADNYWAAKKGRDALKVEWVGGGSANVSSESIFQLYADAAEKEKGLEAKKIGDSGAAAHSAAKSIEAVYWSPYLSQATMEPMNLTADVRSDTCDVYGGMQSQTRALGTIAKLTGLPPEKIKIHTTLLGGGFGRRLEVDYITDAVLLSKAVGKPVKVIWTREDDIQHGFYRTATYNKMVAGIDADAKPLFWKHRIVNSSITAPRRGLKDGQVDGSSVEGAVIPYDIPNLQVDWIRKETGVPVGYWRSVGSSHTAFSTECFIDELAEAANRDPYEFRRSLLTKHPRHKAVLELAAAKAGWGKPTAKGVHRGIAVHACFGSYVAEVAEVSVSNEGRVRVHRVVCAVDCGQVVNPNTVMAQIEGGIVYGLTAVLYGEITIKEGRVQQRNFYDYKMLRMNEMPKVEIHIIPSEEKHGGAGEPGTPPIAPAVVNAIFAATGKRIRQLPIRPEELRTV